jgi:hypothetical protein
VNIEIGAQYRFVHKPRGIFPSLISEHDGRLCHTVVELEPWKELGRYFKVKFETGQVGFAWPEELELP